MFGPLLEVETSKKCTLLWREAHNLQVKMYKAHHSRTPEVETSKKCTLLWREAHNLQVKMYKAHHVRTTFGSWDVEKVHAVVARITFASQNAQSTPIAPWSSQKAPEAPTPPDGYDGQLSPQTGDLSSAEDPRQGSISRGRALHRLACSLRNANHRQYSEPCCLLVDA